MARIRRRLLPFTFLLYIVAYLDRINVGFAALQMNRDLGLGDAEFGLGAGVFFIGYFLFEIPSNLILERVGARAWIARIMISWGAVAMAMATVRGVPSFYLLRFLLGVAEAGFFPGIIVYLTYWFPTPQRARAIALFMTASALAGVIGGPVSGVLLASGGMLGLAGWQRLFILEGLPSVILGVFVLFYLDDGPADARWLTEEEKRWLAEKSCARSGARAGAPPDPRPDGRPGMAAGAALLHNRHRPVWRDHVAAANRQRVWARLATLRSGLSRRFRFWRRPPQWSKSDNPPTGVGNGDGTLLCRPLPERQG